MTYVRVKGFKIFKDRHGKRRCYHRATNTPVNLESFPFGSAEFLAECQRIINLTEKGQTTKPGTLGMLITRYKSHPQFKDLAPRTRSDYQRIFNYLSSIEDTALSRFNPPLIVRIRDRAAEKLGRKWGNYVKTVLSVIFGFGVERGYIDSNPAFKIKGIRRPKDLPKANRPWMDFEREAVLTAIPPHMTVPIALMMFCGLDPKDALSLRRTSIKDGSIDLKRAKTGQAVWLPLPQPVIDALANAPAHDAVTVCATSFGRPWTINGFNTAWQRVRNKLLENNRINHGLTLKGLRHTVATILAEMGKDDRTIADMLGQKTLAMAQHYSDRANRTRKMTPVIKDFDAELNRRRTKFVKPT